MSGPAMYDRDDPRWHRAWNALRARLEALQMGDPDDVCECCGEVWQYMGTDRHGFSDFRHRHHPQTHERVYFKVRCTR